MRAFISKGGEVLGIACMHEVYAQKVFKKPMRRVLSTHVRVMQYKDQLVYECYFELTPLARRAIKRLAREYRVLEVRGYVNNQIVEGIL